MELVPQPRDRTWSSGVWTVLAVAILTPVTLLAAVPAVFGLERYVVAGRAMDGTAGRGSVLFEQRVPLSDVAVGDVISFHPPGARDDMVTRRVVAVDHGTVRTRGDAMSARDPWQLTAPDHPTAGRVAFGVPWVGFLFLGGVTGSWWSWSLLALGLGLGALVVRETARGAHRVPAGSHL